MSNLADVKTKDILPSSIAEDQNVQELSATNDSYLHEIFEKVQCILLLPNLDTLPEDVVDSLAWQYHVDFYELDMPIATKRGMVREAIYWHLIKGTPAAVEKVVANVFQSATVEENWEYGGDPYYFRVADVLEPLTDPDTITRLVTAINSAKNTRSWLEGIEFMRDIPQTIYWAGPMNEHKEVVIGLPQYHAPSVTNARYMAGAMHIHKEEVISNG